eukprot:jgi/Botrbrau1/19580/Bobra.0035s0063.1
MTVHYLKHPPLAYCNWGSAPILPAPAESSSSMSGSGSSVKLEDFLNNSLETSSNFSWASLQDDFQDVPQSYTTEDTFERECAGARCSSPGPSCGLTKEDAQELLMSGELRAPSGLEQLSYMQEGQDLMETYDESSFFPPMEVQQQQGVFCAPAARQMMDSNIQRMSLPPMLPQMSESSGASAETAGPGGRSAVYPSPSGWARTPDTRQACAVAQPRLIQAFPVMAYPMPHHAAFAGGYPQVRGEYPTMVAYYQGNPGWQYGETLCSTWVPSGPMPVMEEIMELTPTSAMMQPPPHMAQMHMHPMSGQPCAVRPAPPRGPQVMLTSPGVPVTYYQHSAPMDTGCGPPQFMGRPPGYPCQETCASSCMGPPQADNCGPVLLSEPMQDMRQMEPLPAEPPCESKPPDNPWKTEPCAAREPTGDVAGLAMMKTRSPTPPPAKMTHHVSSPRVQHQDEMGCSPRRHGAGPPAVRLSRTECLERYREKKRNRLHQPTVRYHMRKINADNRPRVKGRFVKATAPTDFMALFTSGDSPVA